MNLMVKWALPVALAVVCAACSHPQAPAVAATPAAVAPAASAIRMLAPAEATGTAARPAARANGPTLAEMLRRPGFAHAFAALAGASALPAWAKSGGVSTPSERVKVGGASMLLAQACETAGCQTGELLLLVDPARHAMHGLLVQVSGGAGARVQQLAWLGQPDPATETFLRGRIARD